MCARIPKRVHNAGCLPFEARVTYPFHPLANQTVLVVGDIQHAGARHLIIRRPNGATFLLPEWMAGSDAGLIRIIACPRLPVNRLIELRALVDRLMASFSGETIPDGGQAHEVEDTTAEFIRTNSTSQQTIVAAAREGVGAAQIAVEGSAVRSRRRDRGLGTNGGSR